MLLYRRYVSEKSDFGIFVFTPDDEIILREEKSKAVRDNVIFELGLFIGKLGRERSFFLVPQGLDFHLPTDLLGIMPGKYETNRSDGNIGAATGPFCQSVRESIKKIGFIEIEPTISSKEPLDLKDENKDSLDNDWFFQFLIGKYQKGIELIESYKIKEDSKFNELEVASWKAYGFFMLDESNGRSIFRKLIEDNKQSVDPMLKFIDSLYDKEFYQEALNESEGALQKFSDNSEIKEAHRIIHHLFLKHPNNENILFKYFHLMDNQNNNEISLFLINKLINMNSKNYTYWGCKGNICLNLEMNNLSMEAYLKSNELALNPQSWILGNIGNLYKNKGLFGIAINHLQEAIKIDPDSEYAHSRLSSSIQARDQELSKQNEFIKSGSNKIYKIRFPKESDT